MKRKSSKKNESNKYNLNVPKNDEIFLKFNEIEVDGFQVFSQNEPVEEEKNKFGNMINPFEIKNSEDYIKNWKILEELEEAKEEKEVFNELWDNIIKLNNSNILDYSLINELLRYLGNDDSIQRFLFLIYALLDDALDNYLKEESKFLILKNNIIYFMIILTNVKNNERFNYFFSKEKIDYLSLLLPKLEKIKNNNSKILFNNILFKLFTTEYIHLGLNLFLTKDNKNKDEENEDNKNEIILNKDDENINNNNNINNYDSESIKILNNFYQNQKVIQIKEETNKEKYKKIVESLFNFESENFLNLKQNKGEDYSEIFFSHIELVKSIILILFSKEKYQFLKEENVYYEYEFLDKLIKKNISETKSIHEDKHKNLFRRDTTSNNIIKYFFFLFGNHMIIESFMKPLTIILNITGLNNEFEIISFEGNSLNMERNITKDEFNILFDKILEKLNETIPYLFRIFLKMIYDNIIKEYPNLEKNDYSPISSLFFFSYLSNPRIQNIFRIYPDKYLFIKSVYRLIYNVAFNNKFNENDNLNIFNDDIEKYYKKIVEFYENNIMNVDTNNEDNKKYLKNLFEEIGIEYPEFLFYLSCDYINGLNKNDENKE